MYTVGPGIRQKKKLKNVENETQTLFDLEYHEKHSQTWKMSRKLKYIENDFHKMQDLKYGEKTEKTRKMRNSKTHMVGPGTWQETVKNVKNGICTLQDL